MAAMTLILDCDVVPSGSSCKARKQWSSGAATTALHRIDEIHEPVHVVKCKEYDEVMEVVVTGRDLGGGMR